MDLLKKTEPIRILYVEDNQHDQIAFKRVFKESGILCAISCFEKAKKVLVEFGHSEKPSFDIVVSDHALPDMSGLELLKELLDRKISIPVVLLTGNGSEEVAVEAMKSGVDDYIIKAPSNLHFKLLPYTIKGIIKKHKEKKARIEAEAALLRSEKKYKSLVETAPQGIEEIDLEGNILFGSPAWHEMLGYTDGELIGHNLREILPKEAVDKTMSAITSLDSDQPETRLYIDQHQRKDGTIIDVDVAWNYNRNEKGKVIGFIAVISDITERKKTEQKLRDSEEQFRTIFEKSTDSIWLIEPETTRIVAFNEKAHQRLGYSWQEFSCLRISDIEVIQSEEESKKHIEAILTKGEETFRTKHRTKEGQIQDIEVTVNAIKVKEKSFLLSVLHDFTERKESEGKERLSNAVFEYAKEGIMITDANSNILSVNPAFTSITGYTSKEALGKNTRMLHSGRHNNVFYKAMWDEIHTRGHWQGEIWNRRKNGEVYPAWLSITPVKNDQGIVIQYAGFFSDITQRKADEEKLQFQAYYDPLTSLPNRILLRERLSQAIKQVHRKEGKAALLFLDLDHFKKVNDTLGHLSGDEILRKASERLLDSVREVDTVARSGGDEFLILLPDISGREEASHVAEKIIKRLSHPFRFNGHDAFLGGSIGITIVPDDGKEEIELMKNADMALYKAKDKGRNTYCFFSEKMEQTAKTRTLLKWDLKRALKNNNLLLHYQPIIDLNTLKTVSLEALIRWEHPHQGLLLPDSFIYLAEESDLISEIGGWVLQTACTQIKQWQDHYGIDCGVSVNVSSRQFKYGEIWEPLTKALEESGLSPECLTIEIAESLTLDPMEETIEKLKILKGVGIKLSIDDFGTGYSSLSYLSRFPVDLLKIDESFIKNLADDPKKKKMVEAIVKMAQSLQLKVIAEGVEKHEDLSYLRWLDCDMGQGYYFSKPISAKAYEAVLEKLKIDSA